MVAILKPSLINFRPLRTDDLGAVAAIEAASYEFPWTPGIFRDCLHAGYECWVATDESRGRARTAPVIGYGIVTVAVGEAHILNVCIDKAARGLGHGARFVRYLIDVARSHRAERVYLEVRPSNRRAIELYETLGFNEIGKRPNYYPSSRGREDAIVMAMELMTDEGDLPEQWRNG